MNRDFFGFPSNSKEAPRTCGKDGEGRVRGWLWLTLVLGGCRGFPAAFGCRSGRGHGAAAGEEWSKPWASSLLSGWSAGADGGEPGGVGGLWQPGDL